MKKTKESKLVGNLVYCRTLLAVVLIKAENKGDYLNRILKIPTLFDYEKKKVVCY